MAVADRFAEKVKFGKRSECWPWQAFIDPRGYGRFFTSFRPAGISKTVRKNELAHRVAWKLWVGEIPEGMLVLHKCDNPPCVNPRHLYLGTYQDNMDDKVARGRARGRNSKPLEAK